MILYDIFIICHIVFKTVKNKKAGTTASENDKLKNVESIAGCCLYTSFALRWVLDSIIPYVMALPAIILLIVCSHKKKSTENKPTDYEENK